MVLTVGALLQLGFERPREATPARWPTDDAVYSVDEWAVGPLEVEWANGVHHVVRAYHRPDGVSATLALSTGTVAKRIYRAGAEVPFLGSGYTVDPAPPSVVPPAPGRGALLVRRGDELALLLHATGERRGLLGNGPVGWGMVALDAILDRPNDYYLARLVVPLDGLDSPVTVEAVRLADTLFPRLAAWYAD